MKVRDLLTQEHSTFRRLLESVEFFVPLPEHRSRTELSSALHEIVALLPRHEELEDIVFESYAPPISRDDEALVKVLAQHRALGVLRSEIMAALDGAQPCPIERLRSMARFLVMGLRLHLETEENQLWPKHPESLERPADSDLSNPQYRRARLMEKRARRDWAGIAASFR
jgi:hypothetical protein